MSSSLTPNDARPMSCENLEGKRHRMLIDRRDREKSPTGQNLDLKEVERDREVHERRLKIVERS